MCSSWLLHAQSAKKQSDSTHQESTLNRTDFNNRKQGTWFFKHPARMGEPAYAEFGNYQDDLKTGLWYKVDADGVILASENYQRNVLHGTAQYYKNGRLVCVGTYRGLNPDNKFDSIEVVDINTGEVYLAVVPSERGTTKHGIWRYYDPVTGHMIREEEYQIDDLIYSNEFTHATRADSAKVTKREELIRQGKIKKGKTGKVRSYIY
jgi:antitoxin component YwqK of YwqJK toxin-antitoxin module